MNTVTKGMVDAKVSIHVDDSIYSKNYLTMKAVPM